MEKKVKISLTEIMDVSNSNEDVAYQNFWDALWSGNSIQYFDVISKYVPEFAKLRGVPQNPKWHPEGDCDIHVCLVIDNLSHLKDKTLSMAAVFHDIGKPYTTKCLHGFQILALTCHYQAVRLLLIIRVKLLRH